MSGSYRRKSAASRARQKGAKKMQTIDSKSPDQRVNPEREKELRRQLQDRVHQSSQNSLRSQAARVEIEKLKGANHES